MSRSRAAKAARLAERLMARAPAANEPEYPPIQFKWDRVRCWCVECNGRWWPITYVQSNPQRRCSMVRAKFKVQEIKSSVAYGTTKMGQQTVVLTAVNGADGKGNEEWAKYTPSGRLELQIDNPAALEQFKLGSFYYLDFTEAPQEEKQGLGAVGAGG